MQDPVDSNRVSHVLDIYAGLLKTVETLMIYLENNLPDASLIRNEN